MSVWCIQIEQQRKIPHTYVNCGLKMCILISTYSYRYLTGRQTAYTAFYSCCLLKDTAGLRCPGKSHWSIWLGCFYPTSEQQPEPTLTKNLCKHVCVFYWLSSFVCLNGDESIHVLLQWLVISRFSWGCWQARRSSSFLGATISTLRNNTTFFPWLAARSGVCKLLIILFCLYSL